MAPARLAATASDTDWYSFYSHTGYSDAEALQPPLGYQSQPPSQAIQQPPRSGRNNALLGAGGRMFCAVPGHMTRLTPFPFLALAAGAGLAGGVLLTEAFDHHEDEVRQDAYDQG